MKYFRMSYEEVVFNRSYTNIILLNRSIPSYKSKLDDEEDKEENKVEIHSKGKKSFRNEEELFMSLM